MEKREQILYKITSLVDNQGLSENEKTDIYDLIASNPALQFEYDVQNSMKNLVSNRIGRSKSPAHLIDSVISQTSGSSGKNSFINSIKHMFLKPHFVVAVLMLLASIYVINQFNPSTKVFHPNMMVQAEDNFKSILTGELKPQKICSTALEVRNYFNQAGVNYSTVVPEFSDWEILGAVVSEEQGQKLAHHVYSGSQGNLIYVYQVSKDHFSSNKLLDLSDSLFEELESKKFVKFRHNGFSTYFFKCESNIFAMVTNENEEKIEKAFLGTLIENNII